MGEALTGVRVLVVDDHPDSLDVIQQSLSFYGATVEAAATALDALQYLHSADVVVTDFAMPERDGVWLLAKIAESTRPIPVILLSGFSPLHVDAIARAPFARKLLKPVDSSDLIREILSVLGRSVDDGVS